MSEGKHTAPDSFVEQAFELAEHLAAAATDIGYASGAYGREAKLLRELLTRQAARCAQLEEDAARYRWIKDGASVILNKHARWQVPGYSRHEIESCQPCSYELDAAIDAARSVLSQKEQG